MGDEVIADEKVFVHQLIKTDKASLIKKILQVLLP